MASDDIVISVENLSKRYLVGHERAAGGYRSLRETLVRNATNFGRNMLDMARGRQIVQGDDIEEFWALKDVSFELKRGEVLGIIGRNGAGKSTLLKILSRITEPTHGRVRINGRVASLLEVGTGFHPELTGRENIFLNSTILGMTRAETRRKFDEIVEFSGVERFLDTPVKRYSSGMYVRLAFAVAAHLEPEILIVDEVLAVGDLQFQKKCLGKMSEVASGGRTVLFVSHSMAAISALCPRTLVFVDGRLLKDAPTSEALGFYFSSESVSFDDLCDWRWPTGERPGDDTLRIHRVLITQSHAEPASEILVDKGFEVRVEYEQAKSLQGQRVNLQFLTSLGEIAFTTTDHSSRSLEASGAGEYISICRVPPRLFNPGRYLIRLSVDVPGLRVINDWLEIGSFQVCGHHHGGTNFGDKVWPGVLSPECAWIVRSDHNAIKSSVPTLADL
jgi:lipopolysaccharide transport system ATP-binding protein